MSRSSLFTGFHLQNSSSFHSIKPVPATVIGCPMAAACLTAFKLLSICRSSFNFLQTQYRRTLLFLSQSSPAPLLVSVPGISFLTSNLSLFAIYISESCWSSPGPLLKDQPLTTIQPTQVHLFPDVLTLAGLQTLLQLEGRGRQAC